MKRLCSILLAVLLQVLELRSGYSAQMSIRGVVVDPAGAPIEGAVIEIIFVAADGRKAVRAKGRSNSDGAFRIEASNAGTDRLKISVQNRQPIVISLKQ